MPYALDLRLGRNDASKRSMISQPVRRSSGVCWLQWRPMSWEALSPKDVLPLVPARAPGYVLIILIEPVLLKKLNYVVP